MFINIQVLQPPQHDCCPSVAYGLPDVIFSEPGIYV